jgi:hypothetical protein
VSSQQSDEQRKQRSAIVAALSLAALPLAMPLWRTKVLFSVASLSSATLNATAGRSVWRSLSLTVNTARCTEARRRGWCTKCRSVLFDRI